MILLDTNVVIAFFNGNKTVLQRIYADVDRIALSSLVVAELDYGAKASQKAKKISKSCIDSLILFRWFLSILNAPRFLGQ